MTNPAGTFIWYELMTNDLAAAAKFYGAVVGWKLSAAGPVDPQTGLDYRMLERGDGGNAGGIFQLTKDMLEHGGRPAWLGYLFVENVEAACRAIEADGGKTMMPKRTLVVGEIAMMVDPLGAPFYVMTPVPPPGKPDAVSDVFDPDAAQRVRWNELWTPDQPRANAFYAKHFGFEFKDVMPMGPLGDYSLFERGGVRLGATLRKPAESTVEGWLLYFGVTSALGAQRAIEINGGKIVNGLQEIPGGEYSLIATDPQGATFGVVGPKGE